MQYEYDQKNKAGEEARVMGVWFCVGWSEIASLRRWHLSREMKDVRGLVMSVSGRRAAMAGGTAGAKALR